MLMHPRRGAVDHLHTAGISGVTAARTQSQTPALRHRPLSVVDIRGGGTAPFLGGHPEGESLRFNQQPVRLSSPRGIRADLAQLRAVRRRLSLPCFASCSRYRPTFENQPAEADKMARSNVKK